MRSKLLAASLAEEEEIQSGHRDLFQQILVSVNVTALLRMMGNAVQEMGFRSLLSAGAQSVVASYSNDLWPGN